VNDRGQSIVEAHHQRLLPLADARESQRERCQRVLAMAAERRLKLRRASSMKTRPPPTR